MLQKHRTPIAALLLLLTTAQAQPPSPSPATTEPSWGELQRLRAENAALKEKLRAAETQLAASTATQPATQPREVIRKFTTMPDILVKVPNDLRPAAGAEWQKFTANKFANWLASQLVGMKFDQQIALSSTQTLSGLGGMHDQPWTLILAFRSHPFEYFGTTHSWSVTVPWQHIDEASAKSWDKTKTGTLLKVSGTIQEIGLSRTNTAAALPQYAISLKLTNVQISRP
jgi:hypothetical protein